MDRSTDKPSEQKEFFPPQEAFVFSARVRPPRLPTKTCTARPNRRIKVEDEPVQKNEKHHAKHAKPKNGETSRQRRSLKSVCRPISRKQENGGCHTYGSKFSYGACAHDFKLTPFSVRWECPPIAVSGQRLPWLSSEIMVAISGQVFEQRVQNRSRRGRTMKRRSFALVLVALAVALPGFLLQYRRNALRCEADYCQADGLIWSGDYASLPSCPTAWGQNILSA
jgi:hypothetical protein